eukprot:GHVN01100631.1.p1 GENE.GHVN01100631.1~~GHVN01100631.1.p1  ORF type:complete len:833 (-),score=193.49 GHVN01100631.1:67-2565(-)
MRLQSRCSSEAIGSRLTFPQFHQRSRYRVPKVVSSPPYIRALSSLSHFIHSIETEVETPRFQRSLGVSYFTHGGEMERLATRLDKGLKWSYLGCTSTGGRLLPALRMSIAEVCPDTVIMKVSPIELKLILFWQMEKLLAEVPVYSLNNNEMVMAVTLLIDFTGIHSASQLLGYGYSHFLSCLSEVVSVYAPLYFQSVVLYRSRFARHVLWKLFDAVIDQSHFMGGDDEGDDDVGDGVDELYRARPGRRRLSDSSEGDITLPLLYRLYALETPTELHQKFISRGRCVFHTRGTFNDVTIYPIIATKSRLPHSPDESGGPSPPLHASHTPSPIGEEVYFWEAMHRLPVPCYKNGEDQKSVKKTNQHNLSTPGAVDEAAVRSGCANPLGKHVRKSVLVEGVGDTVTVPCKGYHVEVASAALDTALSSLKTITPDLLAWYKRSAFHLMTGMPFDDVMGEDETLSNFFVKSLSTNSPFSPPRASLLNLSDVNRQRVRCCLWKDYNHVDAHLSQHPNPLDSDPPLMMTCDHGPPLYRTDRQERSPHQPHLPPSPLSPLDSTEVVGGMRLTNNLREDFFSRGLKETFTYHQTLTSPRTQPDPPQRTQSGNLNRPLTPVENANRLAMLARKGEEVSEGRKGFAAYTPHSDKGSQKGSDHLLSRSQSRSPLTKGMTVDDFENKLSEYRRRYKPSEDEGGDGKIVENIFQRIDSDLIREEKELKDLRDKEKKEERENKKKKLREEIRTRLKHTSIKLPKRINTAFEDLWTEQDNEIQQNVKERKWNDVHSYLISNRQARDPAKERQEMERWVDMMRMSRRNRSRARALMSTNTNYSYNLIDE